MAPFPTGILGLINKMYMLSMCCHSLQTVIEAISSHSWLTLVFAAEMEPVHAGLQCCMAAGVQKVPAAQGNIKLQDSFPHLSLMKPQPVLGFFIPVMLLAPALLCETLFFFFFF